MTYSLVSIAPVGAVILTFANFTEAAIRLISAGIIVLSIFMFIAFWVCGKSLLNGIDESLQRHEQQQQQLQKMGVLRVTGKEVSTPLQGRGSADPMLLAARKKVKTVVIFAIAILTKVICMLLFAIVSPYGVEIPLLLIVSPMTLIPPIWNIVNVVIHRGRTKLSRGLLLSPGGVASYGQSRLASLSASYVWPSRSRQHQVVATEMSTAAS